MSLVSLLQVVWISKKRIIQKPEVNIVFNRALKQKEK